MGKYNIFPVSNNIKVGVLGGSFNPAHYGHLNISLEAIKYLHLDYVLWLITPQNPLKKNDIQKTLDSRVKFAKRLVVKEKKIIISDIERHFSDKFFYTSEILKRLKQMYPEIQYVWLMGADNLLQLHKWYKWQDIFSTASVAVFDRGDCGIKSLNSKICSLYDKKILTKPLQSDLKKKMLYFLKIKKNPISSEKIRDINNLQYLHKYIHNE